MPSTRLTLAALTSAAIGVVERDGFDGLTLTAVADGLGVATSTLYTHIGGLDGLKHLVAEAATRNLTGQIRNSAIGISGPDALPAMAVAYRRLHALGVAALSPRRPTRAGLRSGLGRRRTIPGPSLVG